MNHYQTRTKPMLASIGLVLVWWCPHYDIHVYMVALSDCQLPFYMFGKSESHGVYFMLAHIKLAVCAILSKPLKVIDVLNEVLLQQSFCVWHLQKSFQYTYIYHLGIWYKSVPLKIYWFHLVRLSVCGQNRVHSVSSTILIGSISYLHIL